MNESKRIFGSIVLAAAVFAFWPIVIGGWSRVQGLRTAVTDRSDLLAQRQTILSDIQAAYQEYQANVKGDNATKFASLVPAHKGQAELVSAINAAAGSSGVTVDGITMTANTGGASASTVQYQTLTLAMDVHGSYPGLKSFLSALEEYVRVLNVQSVAANVDPQTKQLTFTVSADTYFLK